MNSAVLPEPFRNWPLKLLALCIASALWYGIVAEDRVDMILTMPLELRNLPADMIIANQYQKELEVAARGPKRLLREIQQRRIPRPVNLSEAKPGPFVVRNTPESLTLPRGVIVQSVQPANVTLVVDELASRAIPLVARTRGRPAQGRSLDRITLEPASITINGPKSLISRVQAIDTAPIDLEGLEASAVIQVGLAPNEDLRRLIGDAVVRADVFLKEGFLRLIVERVPVHPREPAAHVLITPAEVSVEIEIPAQVRQDAPGLATLLHAAVDPADADQDGMAPVRVETRDLEHRRAIAILGVSPEKVRLTRAPEAKTRAKPSEKHPEKHSEKHSE